MQCYLLLIIVMLLIIDDLNVTILMITMLPIIVPIALCHSERGRGRHVRRRRRTVQSHLLRLVTGPEIRRGVRCRAVLRAEWREGPAVQEPLAQVGGGVLLQSGRSGTTGGQGRLHVLLDVDVAGGDVVHAEGRHRGRDEVAVRAGLIEGLCWPGVQLALEGNGEV